MDTRDQISEFLTTRRARVTPAQAGLPAYGGRRRVKGLRREEVAMLAGISVEYYTRLERGTATGVSEDVLDGVSRALQLDEAERTHLYDLVRTAQATAPNRRRPAQERVRPAVQAVLDAMTDAPAFVRNDRLDVLAANRLGAGLLLVDLRRPDPAAEHRTFVFLSRRATDFFLDWDRIAVDTVGILRQSAGRDPYDKRLTDLIGELSTRSDEFRVRWAAHDVTLHRNGVKRFHHPVVGDLTLGFEGLDLPGDPGQTMLVYTVEPGSPSQEALRLLASWAATSASAEAADRTP